MSLTSTLLFGVIGVLVVSVNGYSSGPPASACVSRTPNHGGIEPKTGSCPYYMSAHFYVPGEPVDMVLSGNATFKGFLISAQLQNGSLVGKWEMFKADAGPKAQSVKTNCDGTSLSHADSSDKDFIVFQFTAPANIDPAVSLIIRYTIVQDFATFWVDCNPFLLGTESKPDQATTTPESTTPTTTSKATTTTTTTTTPLPTTTTTTTPKTTTTTTTTPTPTTTTTTTPKTTTTTTTTPAPTTTTTTTTTTTPTPTTTTTTTTTPASTTSTPKTDTTITTPAPTTTTTTTLKTTTTATTTPKTTTPAPTTTTTTTTTTSAPTTTTPKVTTTATTTKVSTPTTTAPEAATTTSATTPITSGTTPYTSQTSTTTLEPGTQEPTQTTIMQERTTTSFLTTTILRFVGSNTGTETDKGVEEQEIDVPVDPSGYKEGFESESLNGLSEASTSHLKHVTISESECREAGNAYVIVENSGCRRFWQIWTFGRYERICPLGLQFNAENCACSWPGTCSI